MDALAQLAPVAAPLLRDVDTALLTLGAPPTHPVWQALGRVGATPADVVAFVADLEPSRLRAAAEALRAQATAYEQAPLPLDAPWEGETARYYRAAAASVHEHLAGDGPSLASRLRAQASYVDSWAEWQQALRDSLARVLAQAMTSSQAVILRSQMVRPAEVDGLPAAVHAAADIAVVLLGVAEDAAAAGRDVIQAAQGLDELPYRPSLPSDPLTGSATIRLD
ncbi:MAG: hypothetical protein IRY85_09050 [Micromonosporaceae bacterium]|nr:hypothetical protein [Micromonosporaceae bacterium]